MARPSLQSQFATSPLLRYGLAVTCFAIALGLALLAQFWGFHNTEVPLFLFAIAVTVWYARIGAAILAVVLSSLAFDYFFTEPRYSLYITLSEFPYYVFFILFALLLTWFSAIRRRVEQQLLQSHDELQREVVMRTQQANLLNLTHDTIFVRDMSDIISYWNRGAEELYGWGAEEAIGKHSRQFLQTEFPIPIDEIHAELLRTGRWEGELRKSKADGSRVVVASRWSLRQDEQGRPVAILETNNDITERKRREEDIQNLNQELAMRSTELESINKELEAFAYSISHDLRAPLRHMAGYADCFKRRHLPLSMKKATTI
jgi:PAS domain S-box-containing protein